jgi:hypothetical protein
LTTRNQLEWRRAKVQELLVKGKSQSQIAIELQVDKSIISKDVSYLRLQAKGNIRKYVDETLPHEYEKCLDSIRLVLERAWAMVDSDNTSERDKKEALSLINECNRMKLELLTNSAVVHEAIKFIEAKLIKGKSTSDNQTEQVVDLVGDDNVDETTKQDDTVVETEEEVIEQDTYNKVF